MECTINWMPASGMAFSAETGSGHLLMMDGAPEAAVKRAVQMSYEKYCSATAMLAKTAQIDLEVEIVDTAAGG